MPKFVSSTHTLSCWFLLLLFLRGHAKLNGKNRQKINCAKYGQLNFRNHAQTKERKTAIICDQICISFCSLEKSRPPAKSYKIIIQIYDRDQQRATLKVNANLSTPLYIYKLKLYCDRTHAVRFGARILINWTARTSRVAIYWHWYLISIYHSK